MSLEARVSVESGDFTIISSDFRKFTISVEIEGMDNLSADFILEGGEFKFVDNDFFTKDDTFYYPFEQAFLVYLTDYFNIETNPEDIIDASITYFNSGSENANDNLILGAAQEFIAAAAAAA